MGKHSGGGRHRRSSSGLWLMVITLVAMILFVAALTGAVDLLGLVP